MRLVDKSDILDVRQISASVKEAKLNQFIDDAQIADLCPLLGNKLYNDIITTTGMGNTTYHDLLVGGNYDYDGITYDNPGLKTVLSLFVYARYEMFGGYTDTPFGFVEKQYQDGANIDRINRKEVYKANQQTAMMYWQQVKLFLDRNTDIYPLWKACETKKRNFRVEIIR